MMQFVVIVGSLEGHTSNWRDKTFEGLGLDNDHAYACRVADHSDMLFALRPYLEQGHW